MNLNYEDFVKTLQKSNCGIVKLEREALARLFAFRNDFPVMYAKFYDRMKRDYEAQGGKG